MNTEQNERAQMILREMLYTITSNVGIMNLQKVLHRIEEQQNKLDDLIKKEDTSLAYLIAHMSI